MISLEVEDKCQNCPHFSPTVDAIDVTNIGDRGTRLMQTVYCRNKDFCGDLEGYLRKDITNE